MWFLFKFIIVMKKDNIKGFDNVFLSIVVREDIFKGFFLKN